MDNEKVELYYQMRAKELIDTMFDAKVFNEKITRDDIQGFEDLIAFLFQSQSKSAFKSAEFVQKIKHLK